MKTTLRAVRYDCVVAGLLTLAACAGDPAPQASAFTDPVAPMESSAEWLIIDEAALLNEPGGTPIEAVDVGAAVASTGTTRIVDGLVWRELAIDDTRAWVPARDLRTADPLADENAE